MGPLQTISSRVRGSKMARTTIELVEGIIDIESTVATLTPFIDAANSIVTEKCLGSSYTETTLTLIETWLAAHFAAVRDMRMASEKADGVSADYQGTTDMYFEATLYGQMAMTLDTAGNLAALQKEIANGGAAGALAGFVWAGTADDTTEVDA